MQKIVSIEDRQLVHRQLISDRFAFLMICDLISNVHLMAYANVRGQENNPPHRINGWFYVWQFKTAAVLGTTPVRL